MSDVSFEKIKCVYESKEINYEIATSLLFTKVFLTCHIKFVKLLSFTPLIISQNLTEFQNLNIIQWPSEN